MEIVGEMVLQDLVAFLLMFMVEVVAVVPRGHMDWLELLGIVNPKRK